MEESRDAREDVVERRFLGWGFETREEEVDLRLGAILDCGLGV
jgi:hypothetical protein